MNHTLATSRIAAIAILAASGTSLALWALAGAGRPTPITASSEGEPAASTAPVNGLTPNDDLQLARGLSRAFQRVAKEAEPSVVHIIAKKKQAVYERVGFFEVRPTGKTRIVDAGLGSGVIVSKDGLILTNNHVVAEADLLDVRLRDGRVLAGTIVGRDPLTDIAVVRVDAKGLQSATFADSDSLEVGEWVVAIGSPFGFANTVTAGIVSAKGRSNEVQLRELSDESYKDFIQTDAAINPGNSGGPLLNLEGKIIGINSAIASRAGGSEGIGFAIPSTIAQAVMDALIKNGRVVRGWVGASFADLIGTEAKSLGLATNAGVLIRNVVDDSPASRAGLKTGDVVTRFQGRPMTQTSTLRAAVALTPPGTEALLEVIREGKPTKLTVAIGDFEAVQRADIGVTVRKLPAAEAREMGYRNIEGVIIKTLSAGLGQQAGLALNDIIVQVDGQPVTTPEAFEAALGKGSLANGITLGVIRGEQRGSVVIKH
ncbi:MAG: trypsin-like peptidase domain-containing protein [Planctomycetota bacterium]